MASATHGRASLERGQRNRRARSRQRRRAAALHKMIRVLPNRVAARRIDEKGFNADGLTLDLFQILEVPRTAAVKKHSRLKRLQGRLHVLAIGWIRIMG